MTPNELYYQTGKDTILYQSSLHREFSDRAFNLLNLSVATLVAGGVVINFRLDHLEWAWPLISLGTLAILAFIVVAVRCLSVLRTGDWHSFPPLSELSARANHQPQIYQQFGDLLQATVGDYFKDAAQANENILNGKSSAVFWAVLALAVEILATITLVVWIFWGSQTTPSGEVPMQLV